MIYLILDKLLKDMVGRIEGSLEVYLIKSSYQYLKQLVIKQKNPVIADGHLVRTPLQEDRIFQATEAIYRAICELQAYYYDFLATAEVVDYARWQSDDGNANRYRAYTAAYCKWNETEAVIRQAVRVLPAETAEKVCAFHTLLFHLLHNKDKRAKCTAVEHDKTFAENAQQLVRHFRKLNGVN